MSGVHPPLPNEVPGGLPELVIGPDGRIYPATANTTTVIVAANVPLHRPRRRRR